MGKSIKQIKSNVRSVHSKHTPVTCTYTVMRAGLLVSAHNDKKGAEKSANYKHPQAGCGHIVSRV